MTATATPRKRTAAGINTEALLAELQEAREQVETMNAFLEQVQQFSDIVSESKEELTRLIQLEATKKEELTDLKLQISSMRNLIAATNDGMLAVLEPGPKEFMPLFDRMEKSDPKIHGKNAVKWREQPVSMLRLSPLAANLLIQADILFLGQLQDRVLSGDDWWKTVSGLTAPVAAAITDKMIAFAAKGGSL